MRISASSPPARAIRCAISARNLPRAIPCPRWATMSRAISAQIDIQFLPQLEGYIWVFPRCGHLSVGICGKGEPAAALRQRLENYMAQKGIRWKGAAFYSHLLPSLDTPAWKKNRVAGDGWLAVGDAAGLVDPVTGEGIYYALRSADLAAKALLDRTRRHRRKAASLPPHVATRFRRRSGIRVAARQARFSGPFLFGSVPARMVQFTRRSSRFSGVMQDLFAGTQPYLG